MKQGFVSAVLENSTFEQVIDFASAQGFDCVEIACWPKEKKTRRYAGVTHIDVTTLTNEKQKYIMDYCKDKGVMISALAYYPNIMDADLERREYYISHLKKVIDAAEKLNVDIVTTFVGRMAMETIEHNIEEFKKVWPPIVNYAEAKRVKIAIENCPMLFTDDEWPGGQNLACTPPIWRKLFSVIDSDYFGLNYDPSHFVWQRINYIRPIYEFHNKIFHVHYKDIKLRKDALEDVGVLATPLHYMTPRIPGHGDVDWGEYISALREIQYSGPACIEIEDKSFENSKEEIESSLIISRTYLSQFTSFPDKKKENEEV